jgi:hypothetical protein
MVKRWSLTKLTFLNVYQKSKTATTARSLSSTLVSMGDVISEKIDMSQDSTRSDEMKNIFAKAVILKQNNTWYYNLLF